MDVKTICPYCAVGCGLILEADDGRVTGLRPDPDHPVSRGTLCPKGATAHEFIHHPERLTTPLARGPDGTLEPCSWDAAYERVAKGFTHIRDTHGPQALAVISSARATVEENYLAQKFARVVLGTRHVDNCFRICHSATAIGLIDSLGSGAMTNAIHEFAGTRTFLIIGSNTTQSHPIIWNLYVRKAVKEGATLIVVDPRVTPVAAEAGRHLAARPGSEVALLNAMAFHIVREGWTDDAFIAARTEGFDDWVESLAAYAPEDVEEETGVPADAIRQAAETYARETPSAILYGLGVTEHVNGVDNVRAIANLALATGNIGKPGTGVNALRGQNDVQGATDMAAPEWLPGYQKWTDADAVARFETAWGAPIPRPEGLDFLYCSRMWESALEGELRGLYVIGSDPALTEGNMDKVARGLRALDFLVVQEVFPSDTTALADVVLPACTYAEKDGTYVNTERRVQRIRRAIHPVGDSRPDWQILVDLAERMGRPMGISSPEEAFNEMRGLVPSYGGITYERLDTGPGIPWPCPTEAHAGTPTLHTEGFGSRPGGRARFIPVGRGHPDEEPDADFPLLLTTGRGFFQYNAGTMTRRTRMERGEPRCFVQLNRTDASKWGITDRDVVRVRTRRGAVEVEAHVGGIREGVAWMPFHYAESPANRLTNDAVDPECGITELKACAARIEKP